MWIVMSAECSTNQFNLKANPSYNSDFLGLLTTSNSLESEKSKASDRSRSQQSLKSKHIILAPHV